MDQLSAMQTFRRVVDLGSFSAAASQAGMSHTVLSRQVKQLERHLGTQLLTRTTRRLHLTEAGALFYRHCVQILEQMQAMTLELSEHQQQPCGTLRLGVATAFGELELGHWLPDFVERHPLLQIELHCSDRFVDLLEEEIDVCLRVTDHLPDSSLVARRLASSEVLLVAAPGYLERHGAPSNPDELAGHALLGYNQLLHPQRLQLTSACGEQRDVLMPRRLSANSPMALRAAAIGGLGIASFDRFIVHDALQDRRLVSVLEDWRLPARSLYAVYPQSRYLAPKVRVLVDYVQAYYTQTRG
ncbi:LysR family transcriptional regulator [Pseudomonas mosselii]|uniref:LysR family transcriptional regulator n=2 Tax=Pseudomonas mosselii TaxID=78327 RepID=UPI0007700FE3|nr:LysR family transcriptional regulator [Pseudomonas mosselii]AMK32994.1 Transcriptional regulator [Pseudomonas putida]MBC3453821.1 LysR family transcriptional regulator [Pseudomonas mosselii]MDH1656921.1 LysR family transcriptional regulator [Pseudomonas mosselii]MDH1723362.1 LysR family transcriptional regulator [Pseudomonas mosselii]MDN4499401.1 LysR family transcriptional regulator [Pseudomonas mosselii]